MTEFSGATVEDFEIKPRAAPTGWPEPLAEEAFHGLAGEIVHTIEPHTEADPVALLLQLLGGFGNVIGRNPHFVVEADCHGTNLFAALVGETSKARKGSSWGHVQRLLTHVDTAWATKRIQGDLSSGESLVHAVRDAVEKVDKKGKSEVIDEGEVDKRLLVLEAELASPLLVMGREGNTLSATLRNAWDGRDLGTLTKNSRTRATDAHISVIGHITVDEAVRELTATEAANGFANRFLWACVRRSKVLPEGGSLREAELEPLAARLKETAKFAESEGNEPLLRDEAARLVWRRVYPGLSEGKPGLLGAVIARAEAQVMRLASIYALLDESTTITPEHLNAALAVWDYCEESARFIFGERLGDPTADTILSALKKAPDGLSRTDIRDLFGRNVRKGEIERALGLLLQANLAHPKERKTGGRPEERWFAVNNDA